MRASIAPSLKVIPEEIFACNLRPKTETQQTRGEDFGNLGQTLFGGRAAGVDWGFHRLPLRAGAGEWFAVSRYLLPTSAGPQASHGPRRKKLAAGT